MLFKSNFVFAQSEATSFTQSKFFGPVSGFCDYWGKIFDFSVSAAGIITVCILAIGGLYYLISFGSKERTQKAKELMTGALAGFLLIILGWTLFHAISPRLNTCKLEIAYLELKTKSIKDMALNVEGVTPEVGSITPGDPCVGVSDEKLFSTREECEMKGGEGGSKCEGICVKGSNISKETSTGQKKDKTEESSKEERWCCKSKKGCISNPVYYSQGGGASWAKKSYGSCPGGPEQNSIAYVGCGPTTIAMVLSTFGIIKTPDQIADEVFTIGGRACGKGTAGSIAIPGIAKKYGLNAYSTNFEGAKRALLAGEAVIASGGPSTKPGASTTFTKKSHFIFIYCYNETTKTFSIYSSSKVGTGEFPEAIVKQDMVNFWAVSPPM